MSGFGWAYPAGAECDPRAPWNQPDAVELEHCPVEFDGDCHNPNCDHCHCENAPECGCDGANGKCPGVTECQQAEECLCDHTPDPPCRCGDFCRC